VCVWFRVERFPFRAVSSKMIHWGNPKFSLRIFRVEHETPNSNFIRGVDLFNRGEYFEAHEVWEDVWMDCPGSERRFYQALIQAAVAVYHFDRDNFTGASRLFHSGKRYMEPYRPVYHGLNVDEFWRRVAAYLAPALFENIPSAGPRPAISLNPEPTGL
jgi:uncharacterized protein